MNSQQFKKIKLPKSPGVYFFYKGKDILYIGKATSLSDRVKSYFGKDLINTRGPAILDMITQATSIVWEETDSVLEALILEAKLIKKYQPKYNTKEKDNKSFNYVCITKEKIPKVLIIRGRNIILRNYQKVYGPFPNGNQLKEAMKIIRPIFPYFDNDSLKKSNKEFYKQLGLIPEKEYKKNIKNLKLFFEGKKKSVILAFKKDMMSFAKKREFEKADLVKKRIFAIEHINDIALIKDDSLLDKQNFRIEAYDVAHMSGQNMVGVMTVVIDGVLSKSDYRKFIINTQKNANDTGALEEILSRRFRHTEWGIPNMVVIDGSVAQFNVAKKVLDRYQFKIPIVGVIKDDKHKAKAIMGDTTLVKKYKKSILLVNVESHRFAITFHKYKRSKSFINS